MALRHRLQELPAVRRALPQREHACKRDGCVVATGLLASNKFETPIYPFILNGVNLLGIGAGSTPMSLRLKLWNKLMNEWNVCDKLPAIAHEVHLEELKDTYIDAILSGKTRGRIVVKLKENCCERKQTKQVSFQNYFTPKMQEPLRPLTKVMQHGS